MNHQRSHLLKSLLAAGGSQRSLHRNRWLPPAARTVVWGMLITLSPFVFGEMVRIEDDETDLRTIQLTVTAADEPRPALRHRLTLRPQDLRPGNSVSYYMRAYPEHGPAYNMRDLRERFGEVVDDWYRSHFPLSKFPREDIDLANSWTSDFIRDFLDPASHCRDCDWGYNPADLRGKKVITILLPEFQAIRSFCRQLALNSRIAIADHRYDDAINAIRINYRIGQDSGKHPILVSGLIGIAITGITNWNVTELIAAPDSPNLYWALSELPNPPISILEAIRLEMAMGPRMHLVLDNLDAEHTPEEWNAIWKQQWMAFYDLNGGGGAPGTIFVPLLSGLNGYAHAKQRLVDWGRTPEEVEQMAVGQVLALYSARVYQIAVDEEEKSYYIPFSQRKPSDHLEQIGVFSDHPDRELIPVAQLLLPSSQVARSAEVRVAREIAALRVIESLRMHAAQNEGQLPRSLDAVTCVPVPLNPATDKPFRYHLEHKTAVLELPDWEGFPGHSVRYEVTIAD